MGRKLAGVTAVALAAVLGLTACGKDQGNASDPTTGANTATSAAGTEGTTGEKKAEELKPYEIQWYYQGNAQEGQPEVEEALNAYLKEKINATVVLNPIDWGSYAQKIPTMIQAGEKFDICQTASWGVIYSQNASKGAYVAIDDLMKQYAPKTLALFSEEYLDGARVDGNLYAVPANKDKAHSFGLIYNKTYADQYGIDMSQIKDYDDILPMLREAKQKLPEEIIPFGYVDVAPYWHTTIFDDITGNLGAYVIRTEGDDTTVLWKDGTPEYDMARKWSRTVYTEGLTRADCLTYTNWTPDWNGGRIFCYWTQTKPGKAAEVQSNMPGAEIGQIDIGKPISGYNDVTGSMMAISRTSEDPERCMMFLELLNTDPYVNNLINYGIENRDYTKVSDNVIKIADDRKFTNNGNQWLFGNQYINYIVEGEAENKWELMDTFNNEALISKAMGFVFDPEPVKQQIAAVGDASQELSNALYYGVVDPDVEFPKHKKAQEAAGLNEIIAEIQKQFDEWLANH